MRGKHTVPHRARSGNDPSRDGGTRTPGAAPLDSAEVEELAESPTIPDEQIVVGAGGLLSIPREEIEDDSADEDELGGAAVKIRRPGRREFIIINPALELSTKLIVHKPKGPDSMDEEFYWVASELRKAIRGELKPVRVVPYFSTPARCHGLWVVKVTLGNPWYTSIQDLVFRQPPEFFATYEVRVFGDKDLGRYRVMRRPRSIQAVTWPERPTGELLAEALGPSHIICSADHPLYVDLVSGEEVA
jgi:hypothetical protein